jgi:hypothetical protein
MANPAVVLFRTSLYGRFGHLVMAVLPVALTLTLGTIIALGGIRFEGVWVSVGTLGMFLMVFGMAIYCIAFSLRGGNRVTCSRECLVYRGLLREVVIPWSAITELWINFGGQSPFVFLVVRANLRRWPYWINMSGLTPSYVALFALARTMAPQANVWVPRRYEVLEAADSALARTMSECLVDDSLTLVRADAPEAARRST